MRIYISLPISGQEDAARAKAAKIARHITLQGREPVNPFDIVPDSFFGDPRYEDYISADIRELLNCDAIYFCEGWEKSCGCMIERQIAETLTRFGKKRYAFFYEVPPQIEGL